jgi:hypothetical protein
MSYIKTSTVDDLGRRPLSYYERAKFPLPTTSMSRVIRTRTMGWDTQLGWDNAPYGSYRQPELSRTRQLNGEWVPPGPPPRAMAQNNGAITYRVNPATGKYQFYNTDVLPRGVFRQNTFQHPATQTLSAFGVAMPVTGQQLVQLPSGQQILSRTAPGKHPCKTGGSCKCHGKCKRSRSMSGLRGLFGLRGLGTADFPGACGPQSDGSIIPCGADPSGAADQGDVAVPGFTPTVTAPAPGTQIETIDTVNGPTIVTSGPSSSSTPSFFQSIASAFGAKPTTVLQAQAPSWFNQSTIIGGTAVSNGTLAMGAGLAAIVISGMGGKKRR